MMPDIRVAELHNRVVNRLALPTALVVAAEEEYRIIGARPENDRREKHHRENGYIEADMHSQERDNGA